MTDSGRDEALGLLKRLLDGERGDLASHLGYLVDKSSCMRDSDKFYREVLPPELADLHLSTNTLEEIVAALCVSVAMDPDAAFLQVLAWSEERIAVSTVAQILVKPPRPLSIREYATAVTFVKACLPACLQDDPNFISESDLQSLVKLAEQLKTLAPEEGKTDIERAEINLVRIQADYLLEGLAESGFIPI